MVLMKSASHKHFILPADGFLSIGIVAAQGHNKVVMSITGATAILVAIYKRIICFT